LTENAPYIYIYSYKDYLIILIIQYSFTLYRQMHEKMLLKLNLNQGNIMTEKLILKLLNWEIKYFY